MDSPYKEIGLVALAGALGGGGSLLYSATIGVTPAIDAIPWGVPAYLILGAIAAILGVFLIAKTDTRHLPHCLAFAMACGIFWAPIFEATAALIQKKKEETVNAKVSERVKGARAAIEKLAKTSDNELPKATASVVAEIQELAAAYPEVRDRRVSTAIAGTFTEALSTLGEVQKRNPAVAKNAINEIRTAQAANSLPNTLVVPMRWQTAPLDIREFAYQPSFREERATKAK